MSALGPERARRQEELDFSLPPETVNRLRDQAIQQVTEHAEEHAPSFGERARAFVVEYLLEHGPTNGEQLTQACKDAGIRAHDDRAFGAVYMRLVKAGSITKVGTVRRERGHGTAGGNVWALAGSESQPGRV